MNAQPIIETAESPYAALPLNQLRAQYEAWLQAGFKIAPVLVKIVKTLGRPETDPTGRCPLNFQGVVGAGWQAYFWEIIDGRDTQHDCWRTHGRLWIEARNQTPVRLEFVNGEAKALPGSVFIPGRWVDELLGMEAAAEATIEQREKNIDQSELDHLRSLMGVGVLI